MGEDLIMPVQATQHRDKTGYFQNNRHKNITGSSTTPVHGIDQGRTAALNEVRHSGGLVSRAANYSEEMSRQYPQQRAAAAILLLLSQVKLADSLVSSPTDNNASSAARNMTLPVSGYTAHSDNSGNGILSSSAIARDGKRNMSLSVSRDTAHSDNSGNGILSSFSVVLDGIQFMVKHDPLSFSEADVDALLSEGVNSITATDIVRDINESRYLSGDIGKRVIKIVSAIERREDSIAIKNVINKLNRIATDAEDKYPSDTTEKNIDHLIYLIENSDGIISDFEIKHHQNSLCNQLKMQLENYIKTAVDITDKKSALKFKEYIRKIPSLVLTPDSRGESYQSV